MSKYTKFLKKSGYANGIKGALPVHSFLFRSIRITENPVIAFIDSHIIHYPTPVNLSYAWSFGSSAGLCLVIQLITGIILAMHYTPHIDYAYISIDYIMRDVPQGWLVRYTHSNGASIFFLTVYAHMIRGFYYGSYMQPRQLLWVSGVVIFFLMMGTAFMGYVLPWGQMGFWGGTVITSMVTAVPKVGRHLVEWVWGGYVITYPTIRRFYVVHVVLPFVIVGLTFFHLVLLHRHGSNNPLGIKGDAHTVPFYPYFFVKDLFGFVCLMCVFCYLVFFDPEYLGHPLSYEPVDYIETPARIVPEWYFLPFYTILKAVPHKVGGILAMLGSVFVLMLIPYTNTSEVRNTTYRPIFRILFWTLVVDCYMLTWLGQQDPLEKFFHPYVAYYTAYYFFFFLVLFPITGIIEGKLARRKLTHVSHWK